MRAVVVFFRVLVARVDRDVVVLAIGNSPYCFQFGNTVTARPTRLHPIGEIDISFDVIASIRQRKRAQKPPRPSMHFPKGISAP